MKKAIYFIMLLVGLLGFSQGNKSFEKIKLNELEALPSVSDGNDTINVKSVIKTDEDIFLKGVIPDSIAATRGYVDANGGGTTINGTTDNGVLTYINTSGEIQVESGLTFDNNVLQTSEITGPLNNDFVISGNGAGDISFLTNGVERGAIRSSGTWDFLGELLFGVNTIASQNNSNINIQANGTGFIILNDAVDINGNLDVDDIESQSANTDLTLSGNGTGVVSIADNLKFDKSGGTALISTSTSDGSDTGATRITGGGDDGFNRGALMILNGNESSSNEGDIFFTTGNVVGSDIKFQIQATTGGTELTIADDLVTVANDLEVGGDGTFSGDVNVGDGTTTSIISILGGNAGNDSRINYRGNGATYFSSGFDQSLDQFVINNGVNFSGTSVFAIDRANGDATFSGEVTFAEGLSGGASDVVVQLADETISNTGLRAIIARGSSRQSYIGVYNKSSTITPVVFLERPNGTNQWYFTNDAGNLMSTTATSSIGTGGAEVGTQSSDIRLKDTLSYNYGLDEILQINPIKFTYKNDVDKEERIGFSAQEVQGILPEVVYDTEEEIEGSKEGDSTKLAMRYAEMVPVLVSAIKEQNALIEDLKARIEILEDQ